MLANEIILHPPAKVNVHLEVVGKRPDGYHNLVSIFAKTTLTDRLTMTFTEAPSFHLEYEEDEGCEKITWQSQQDILYKTYKAYLEKTSWQGGVSLKLAKKIPFGAGLGGGSSDCASFLQALNSHTHLLNEEELLQLGQSLGADVPFFLKNYPVALALETGNLLKPLPSFNLTLLLMKPKNISISTQEAFGSLTPSLFPTQIDLEQLQTNWVNQDFKFTNTFSTALQKSYPYIEEYKQALYRQQALFAELSGTGSTVVGYFTNPEQAQRALQKLQAQFEECWLGRADLV